MVKITIKTKDLPPSSGSEDSEAESEGSDAESTGSARSRNGNSVTKSGRSKRKCVVNFEKKKAKTSRTSKSRSKSVTPLEDEDDEEEVEERPPKEIFSCDICTKAFHSKFMMRTHVKAHRKIEENAKCDKYYHYYLNSIN